MSTATLSKALTMFIPSTESFVDELIKISKDLTSQNPKWNKAKKLGLTAAGVAGGLGLAAAGVVAARPALRAHALADLKALRHGVNAHEVERAKALPPEALRQAEAVAAYLRSMGIDPAKHRVAISATGGTGKSTLAKGLAQHLGMDVLHMDDVGKSLTGRNLKKWVGQNELKPGLIAEQTHLLNQVDPDKFDAIIHLDKPMEQVKEQILNRGRGAGQLDVYNYDRLHDAIQTGFHHTAGEAHEVTPGIRVKMRPPTGFQSEALLDRSLAEKGINATGMTRQQKILSVTTGTHQSGAGLLPYLRTGNIAAGAGIVGAGGVAGGLGASALQNQVATGAPTSGLAGSSPLPRG